MNRQKEIMGYIQTVTANSPDIVYREQDVSGNIIYIIFNETLCDSSIIIDIIKNIEKVSNKELTLNVEILEKKLKTLKVKKIDIDKDDLFYYIYSGFSLIMVSDGVLAIPTNKDLNRSIGEIKTEATVKGPRDAFNESYSTNLGLIRKRIKSEKLDLIENIVGRRTKSKVGIMYISDIAKLELVKQIEAKIKDIDIDGILDSNHIRECVMPDNGAIFPSVISTERPDLVAFYLLQGRVVVVVENSPFVLVFPSFISDFFKNMEDYYQENNAQFISRVVRYLAFFITLFLPAIYIAITTFNHESIPTDLLISFATQRNGVPFPAIIEAVIMIMSFEILREGDLRIPGAGGSSLSIVGSLIIGQAAVSAGITSPIMIIVVALTSISSLTFSDPNIINSLKIWRIIFLMFASLAGLFGVAVALFIFIMKLVSVSSISLPFTYPFAPIDLDVLASDTIYRKNTSDLKKRMKVLTSNLTKFKEVQDD